MAYKLSKIQLRRDTAENWSSANPILLPGELGYDITNKYIKINYNSGASRWNDLSVIHIPVEAVDNLSVTGSNTIYDLSNVTDMGFILISADSVQKKWSSVAKFEAKDWSDEISVSKNEAIAVSLSNAKTLIEKLSVALDPKIKTAQDAADLAQSNIGRLSGYVGKFNAEDETVDTVIKYVDSQISSIPAPDMSGYVKLSSDIQQKISSDIEINGFVSIGSLSVGSQATEPFQRLKELMQQKLSRLDPETASTFDIVSALQSIYLGGSI